MTMSRQDFEFIARIIRQSGTTADAKAIALKFATELQGTNAKFNRARFLEACGFPNA